MSTEIKKAEDQNSSTKAQEGGDEPHSFKAITIRAKENTVDFFQKVIDVQNKHNLNTTESSTIVLAELLGAQAVAKEQAEKISQLEKEIADFVKTNKNLQEQIDQHVNKPVLSESQHLVEVNPKRAILFDRISKNRFAKESIRKRYKLEYPETVGELLINCLLTEEILLNHNDCFYTGLTREALINHKQ